MFRRLALLGLVMLCAAALPTVACAAMPEGPRLAYVREGLAIPGFEELLDSDQSGERWELLAVPSYSSGGFENLTWSWDGSRLAFNGAFGGGIYALPATGRKPRFVRGTALGLSPAFSPDGKSIAFARLRIRRGANHRLSFESSIWLIAATGGRAHRLSPWRDRFLLLPAAFSPDGKSLLVEAEAPGAGQEIVSLPVAGGPLTLILRNGLKPAYSPDGSHIAFVRYIHRRVAPGPKGIATGGDLFVAASDGTG